MPASSLWNTGLTLSWMMLLDLTSTRSKCPTSIALSLVANYFATQPYTCQFVEAVSTSTHCDHHGSCRPREDDTSRYAPIYFRSKGRGRRHHPTYRRFLGPYESWHTRRGPVQIYYVSRHAGTRGI